MSSNGFSVWTAAKWSDSDIEAAVKLRSMGRNCTEIGQVVGRSNRAVRALFRRIKKPKPDTRKTRDNSRFVGSRSVPVPDDLAAQRDARFEEPRTITMEFCGDPEPSRSALKRFIP